MTNRLACRKYGKNWIGVGILVGFCLVGTACSRLQSELKETELKETEPKETEPVVHQNTNRLAHETSPYLLLHAHNPVDWYPWGEEALEKARRENKLIFLSVGYSSCYWCHVMERESFMDEEIAAYLNDHFVCIKVDREERPDIDAIYMHAVQLSSGRGGWPMSVFLIPGVDAKPFAGGTYFPARDGDRSGAKGFLTIVREMQKLWTEERPKIVSTAELVAREIQKNLQRHQELQPEELNGALLDHTLEQLAAEYDPEQGGFGFSLFNVDRPKFPEPSKLLFLLQRARSPDGEPAQSMLLASLDRMMLGGIRDHLGGGFHRYSTDRYWRIPHFEKMLYDNGQLATIYAEAFSLTQNPAYRLVVEEMLDFILREMTSPEGGFYSALDAETDAEEGKFYRWTVDEMQAELTTEQWNLFAPIYGLNQGPNFEHKYYVPLVTPTDDSLSQDLQKTIHPGLKPIRSKLLDARGRRQRPLLDTKIITGWNGLMIRGFADAGRIFHHQPYLQTAERVADFVLAELQTEDGHFMRNFAGGKAKLNAFLDDYAFLTDGLIALHRATGDMKWLTTAQAITDRQVELFWDDTHGGFYFTSDDHESLLARLKDPHDGVRPSGSSVSADNLVYLARELDRQDYLDRAEETIQSSADLLRERPAAVTRMAVAVMALLEARGE